MIIDNYWEDEKRRREFFDSFATENGFDPLVPENWYSVSTNELRETKVIINNNNNKFYSINY